MALILRKCSENLKPGRQSGKRRFAGENKLCLLHITDYEIPDARAFRIHNCRISETLYIQFQILQKLLFLLFGFGRILTQNIFRFDLQLAHFPSANKNALYPYG
jgi:hypothetical protein